MAKIDGQMMTIFQTYKQGSSGAHKKVTDSGTTQILKRAKEINESSSNSFRKNHPKGNREIEKLLNEYPDDFTSQDKRRINQFLTTGEVPEVRSNPAVNTAASSTPRPSARNTASSTSSHPARESRTSDRVNERHDRNEPVRSNRPPREEERTVRTDRNTSTGTTNNNVSSSSTNRRPASTNTSPAPSAPAVAPRAPASSPAPAVVSSAPVSSPAPAIAASTTVSVPTSSTASTPSVVTTPSTPTPTIPAPSVIPPSVSSVAPATAVGNTVGTIGPHGKIIIDFHSSHKTWHCHWFPMQETQPGGDPVNNLYAVGGALDKLDKVTGKRSRQHEFEHSRKAQDAGKQYAWWGHCNNACEAATILQRPKHAVVVKALDGTDVKFTTTDIQGLLVKVTPSLVERVDFKGQRFNTPARDDINDPVPELFLAVMKDWCKDDLPFVLDIDRGEMVWNYPYDQVRVSESDKAPNGFNAGGLPQDGSVKFYHIEMSGTGFDDKKRVYECYIQYGEGGKVVGSSWIKTPNTHNNPDFMWRPHARADINDKSSWQLRGRVSNPEVDPQMVYDLYMKSLA